MNTVSLHVTYNFGYRITDASVINSDISYLSAVAEGLQGCLAYMEKIADLGRSHQFDCSLSTQTVSQYYDHIAQKFVLVKDTIESFLLN